MIPNDSVDVARLNDLSAVILSSAIAVHRELGPGLLESVYQKCLIIELENRKVNVSKMVTVPLTYKSTPTEKDFIVDILVEGEIILELKSVETILPVHEAQIITYLKLSNKRLGFLINFNVRLLKQGFKRFVNNF